MSNFSFKATAECQLCGAFLSSSDEDCGHDGREVHSQVFRRIGGGRDDIVGVKSTTPHKWHKLEEKVGDDWIAYQWLGPRESVNSMLHLWGDIEDIPHRAMSVDAPNDVGNDE